LENLIDDERLLANAVSFLIQGQELYEASILLLCKVDTTIVEQYSDATTIEVELRGSRAIYDIIQDKKHASTIAVTNAFSAVVPSGVSVYGLSCRVEYPDFDSNWRTTLLEVIEGKRPLNQCVPIEEKPRYPWENLFFRSPVEIVIAKALDKCGVLFLPNCMGRLGRPGSRENREADFLVCLEGKWGILEINGDAYHTNSAKDHNRGRLFKLHGIRVFEPYEARRCINEPDSVVREFLELIRKNA
jgi:hypothetical protein